MMNYVVDPPIELCSEAFWYAMYINGYDGIVTIPLIIIIISHSFTIYSKT